jgi:HPt (histidine-containing phosphotransfer) domain-containing protein
VLGFDAYLTKPFEIEQLATILKRFCKASHESSDVVLLEEEDDTDEYCENATLSRAVIKTMRQLDAKQPGALKRIFEACIVALPDECKHVEETWRAGDAEQLRQAAQSLRSISSTVGATRLAALSKEIADVAAAAADQNEPAIFDSGKFDATRFAVEEATEWLQVEIDQCAKVA